jgi:hypothetical protein
VLAISTVSDALDLQFPAVAQVCDPTNGTRYPDSETGGTSRLRGRWKGRIAEVGANSDAARATPVIRRAQVRRTMLKSFSKRMARAKKT